MKLIFFVENFLQGMYYRSGHRSDVVLAVTWTFFAFVIINIYSSCLTSYTSLTYKRSEIGTFEDLANHPEYGVSTLKGSIMEISILVIKHHIIFNSLKCFTL